MGRPKGAKTKPMLDEKNIIQSNNKEIDENGNTSPPKQAPGRSKSAIGTRGAKKSKPLQVYHDLVGPHIGFFPPSKLPQNKVVLQRYMHLREQHGNMVKQQKLVNILYTELLTEVWKSARIFPLGDKECKKVIDSLINKFRNFKKRPYTGSKDCPANTDESTSFLAKLCDLAPPNLKELLQGTYKLNKKWEDDWKFYLNMCQAKQVGCVAGKDLNLAGKEQQKAKHCTRPFKR
jgi:hypothetical protein